MNIPLFSQYNQVQLAEEDMPHLSESGLSILVMNTPPPNDHSLSPHAERVLLEYTSHGMPEDSGWDE